MTKNSPTLGCQKIKGISELPLTTADVCDKRDACDIISAGASCVSTAYDRALAGGSISAESPFMTCSSKNCSATSVKHNCSNLEKFNFI